MEKKKKKTLEVCVLTKQYSYSDLSPTELFCSDRGTALPEHTDQHSQLLAATADQMWIFQHARS